MLDVVRLRILAAVARHGSVTAAARELHYSQPSVSHHLARLEAETGAQLFQRVGRGIRLTDAGRMLAERATEIVGRVDSAAAELSSHVGLNAGRVRVATFGSVLVSILPEVSGVLTERHPGLQLEFVDTHPPEALAMLRAGEVDAAIVFRYDATEPDHEGIRLTHLRDDPTYLLTRDKKRKVEQHRDERWVAGCLRCREHLIDVCDRHGFEPQIAFTTDDMVTIQALVAAGMGVATIPGLALRAHHHPDVNAYEIPGADRHVYVATYGEPPDPPATAALLDVLVSLD
ncbi:LysR family transcriptional regulator [Aeromicrobium sp.]|uniref:LysR family transcriptional regulator n=1 Tax=Aeromicrobium sp. TaxID=1871063 RepID=UPI003C6840AD